MASLVQAEGMAILSALQRMKAEGWQRVKIWSDSKEWINFVNNFVSIPWDLQSLYKDILSLAREANAKLFVHINQT